VIWCGREIMADDALKLSVLDRTFEHGLGLFETLRTWNGHPTLLERHRRRLLQSAGELGLSIDPSQFPDACAVSTLVVACNRVGEPEVLLDHRLRITLSGGLPGAGPPLSRLWMTAGPLPPPLARPGVVIKKSIQVAADDPLQRHKTLNYWRKRIAHEAALADGSDEVLCVTPDGLLCEGTRSNLFVVVGRRLHTPSLDGPLLPGTMRQLVLERTRGLGIETVEAPIALDELAKASEAFLTSSVRGILPIAQLFDYRLPAPGPITNRIWTDTSAWLESGGTVP
jgi:branched-subunit amino acid aminotransferase/4-amino-4-deoxychorismate lyase